MRKSRNDTPPQQHAGRADRGRVGDHEGGLGEAALHGGDRSGRAGRDRDRAYSTVKTTMDRMVEKGFLRIAKIRNLQLFSPCVSEIEARRGEFRRMLQRAFDGALTPMMQFLIEHEGLSKDEASQLRELIRKTEGKKDLT